MLRNLYVSDRFSVFLSKVLIVLGFCKYTSWKLGKSCLLWTFQIKVLIVSSVFFPLFVWSYIVANAYRLYTVWYCFNCDTLCQILFSLLWVYLMILFSANWFGRYIMTILSQLGVVAKDCNPSTQKGLREEDCWEPRASLDYRVSWRLDWIA